MCCGTEEWDEEHEQKQKLKDHGRIEKSERGKLTETTDGEWTAVETVTSKREKVLFLGNVETTKFEKAEEY